MTKDRWRKLTLYFDPLSFHKNVAVSFLFVTGQEHYWENMP